MEVQSERAQFELINDLGAIVVPSDYIHQTRLTSFAKRHRQDFSDYDPKINDANFANPSKVLKRGEQLRVEVWRIVDYCGTRSPEHLKFLQSLSGTVFPGIQGSSLVWEQKRDRLAKSQWYVSVAEPERLPLIGGFPYMPYMCEYVSGLAYLKLQWFGTYGSPNDVLLRYCEKD